MSAESNKETITITVEQYNELCRDSDILNALRNNGVDNWEWYDEAMKSLDSDDN